MPIRAHKIEQMNNEPYKIPLPRIEHSSKKAEKAQFACF